MRLVRLRSWVDLFVLVFALAVSTYGIGRAETKEEARWSIDFGEISISEALDQLTKVTGIKIVAKTPLSNRISPKRYRNQSIEQILKDLLKNVNFAAVWQYSESGIESIGILAFDRQRVESHISGSSASNAGTMPHAIPRISRPKRLPPSGQVSVTEGGEGVKEPPAEQEETEDSEAEDRDEEAEQSSTEDTSRQDSENARLKPATVSSSGEEGLPKDQQNEGKE